MPALVAHENSDVLANNGVGQEKFSSMGANPVGWHPRLAGNHPRPKGMVAVSHEGNLRLNGAPRIDNLFRKHHVLVGCLGLVLGNRLFRWEAVVNGVLAHGHALSHRFVATLTAGKDNHGALANLTELLSIKFQCAIDPLPQ